APPEAKPSPPGAKPSLPPEAKPAPAGGAKPAPAPEAKPSLPPKPKPSPAASLTPGHEQAIRELVHMATGSALTDAMLQRIAQSRQAEFAQRLRDELAREFSP